MFQKNEFLELVTKVAEQAAEENGCTVAEVSCASEKDGRVLRVTIENDETDLDKCALISRKISKWLDENEENIPYRTYSLEVSSPGALRRLKTRSDFEKISGKLVSLETKSKAADGRKRYKGRVKSVSDEIVSIYVEDESMQFDITLGDISKARIEYEF